MGQFKLGFISSRFTKWLVIVVLLQALVVFTFLGYTSWSDTSKGCVQCHSNKALLEKAGYPQFYVTEEMVETQSRHPHIQCRDCHLGNGREDDKDRAHEGMLKALLVGWNGELIDRFDYSRDPIIPTGENRINELLPKVEEDGELEVIYELRNLLWHDRDPVTFNFDPEIARKTCSKSKCHPNELEQFKKTIMGRNFRQRFMKTWTDPYGPHNCGPSFADLPPTEEIIGSGFLYENTDEIVKNLNVPFSKEQAEAKQKFCNVCHAGCLDCHYTPNRKEGVHSFTKVPQSESCAGFGRGTSICHPGAMQSRRGETYIGGDYSVPPGQEADVHYEKGIHCVDCHPTGETGMGDMERKATCQDCHIEIEEAHAESIHKNLDCASCHISELRGYQLTIWGPGIEAEKPNPFKKYSLYYGIQEPPILLKDQNGIWRPYKIWPHSVGNIKNDMPPSPSLRYRWPDGETYDAYYVVGTVDNLPANNKHLLWIQIEQAAHPFGRARECDSCHREQQISLSTWEFYDNYGAEPFEGGHRIVADSRGLRIEDLGNTTEIEVMEGFQLSDFASWLYLKDRWQMPGDFAVRSGKEKYDKYFELSKRLSDNVKVLDELSQEFTRENLKRYKTVKGIALHNLDQEHNVTDQFSPFLTPDP